ncbi:hypothetical protein [Mastigocoleus testarum]|uniref:Uncharacterized protein n=1 Tax=Mastigocoleus testarum BC008 TaxID=371196 RepID=A0A0V7ZME0_9CYAN|nr:hypothetical protein [Mastigocoleus testarum]KST65676.1 hypothetical protein BC008_22105 [Mastigocoleus testarum BC008]
MNNNWKKVVIKTATTGAFLGLAFSSVLSPVYAGWGIKDLDVFNRNSGIRKTGRELDQRRLDETAYKFYLDNACPSPIKVQVKYIPRNSSKWKITNYSLKAGQHGYLFPTRNAIVYLSARSSNPYLKKRIWPRRKIHMGSNFLKYTYRLTCS